MSAAALSPAAEVARLPPLRQDLAIELVPAPGGGFPAAIVTDPVRGSYFRLDWPESGILLLWNDAKTAEELCTLLAAQYGVAASPQDIAAVAEFAHETQLTESDPNGSWQRYATLHAAGRHGWFKTLLHGYLFFRIPLVHPERWLQALLPRVSFVFVRTFWLGLGLAALFGFTLATQQWTAILTAAHDALRLEGLHIYAIAILGLKAIHEMGHGLATVRCGCRVPSMGIAVMLGVPVLYTDTSDSWRLARRSQRLVIVLAGVAAEMIVATLAILVWSFLPDGSARQICFALATTSIVLSIAVNLNPFMRFDGYYALSDYLDIPNLQSRAFKLATWAMREALFGLGHRSPESLPARTQIVLITFGCLTAIYRMFLFLGIAAILLVMAGKAIGIVLALFEIGLFIVHPIAREIASWWHLRREIIDHSRARWTGLAVAAAMAAFFVPWMSAVEAPAVLVAEREEGLYLPFAARLTDISVTEGQIVNAGQILFRADAADLARQRATAELEHRALLFQAGRLHASSTEREERVVVESRLARAREKVTAIARQQDQLILRAPFAGRIVDIDPEISGGLWLDRKRQLARLVASTHARVKGFVRDIDIGRITTGAAALFIPDDPTAAHRRLVVIGIAPASDGRLGEPILADRHGGSILSGEEHGELRTRHGWFEITFECPDQPPAQLLRGVALVDATAASPARLAWQQIMRVLLREQGF